VIDAYSSTLPFVLPSRFRQKPKPFLVGVCVYKITNTYIGVPFVRRCGQGNEQIMHAAIITMQEKIYINVLFCTGTMA
jgi:hypothetical protein